MTTANTAGTASPTPRLVLIDGKSVFYRGYYAMGALSLPDGTPTGGIYGFAAIAMHIVQQLNPTKVVVAWDSKSSTSQRRALYPDYKAGRVKPGADFYAQIPLLSELVHALGWAFIELADYEADDIIGTLAREASAASWDTYIISSDLDMLQIVDAHTHMWRILKGFSRIEQISVPELEAKYGIKKSQFLDLKALKGDTSDNIPGVPGIGEKTAAKLLATYGSLDSIYTHLPDISPSLQKKLTTSRDSAYLSRKLAKIMFDAPIHLADIPNFTYSSTSIIAGLKKLQFNSLIKKYAQSKNLGNPEEPEELEGSEKSTFGGVQRLLPRMQGTSSVKTGASDPSPENTFSDSSNPSKAAKDGRERPVPRKHLSSSPHAVAQPILGWDIKSLMHTDPAIAQQILHGTPFWDLGQAAFLLNPLERPGEPPLIDAEAAYAEQRQALAHLPLLTQVLTKLDLPLIPVLYQMEQTGMLIDRAYFTKLRQEYTAEVHQLETAIYTACGREFNLNSPLQLSEVLFTDLRLPTKGIKKTTRGYSTGARELEKLKGQHPVIEQIMAYREASKLLSTYILPMPSLADASHRVHTTFTQNVTATGRLSSQNPNLQNIPVRTDEGRRIRTGFIAPEGKILISADYSQFELRLAAVLAGDTAMIADFNAGVDIHTKTAAEAFGVPIEAVTKQQRRAAKAINFGIIYGMSANGLAQAAGMTIAEAQQFIKNYFRLRAPIKQRLDAYLRQAREQGYVETFYGRRRPTPDVHSSNFVVRQGAERAAINMPIQGTEADLMKRAMLKVAAALPPEAQLIMQVHDSLIVECPTSAAATVSTILQREMEGVAPELPIRLAVEVTSGPNWGEL